MLWWGWWRAEPEVAMERGHVVQSLRCRHFIHEWNWQSAAALASPHFFPSRRWNGFLNVPYGGGTPRRRLLPSQAAAWADARPLCFVGQRFILSFWSPDLRFERNKQTEKRIAAVMTIKQIAISLMFFREMFPVSSRCLFSMSRRFQVSWSLIPSLFNFFFAFSLYWITTNSHAWSSASWKTSHQPHKWQQ